MCMKSFKMFLKRVSKVSFFTGLNWVWAWITLPQPKVLSFVITWRWLPIFLELLIWLGIGSHRATNAAISQICTKPPCVLHYFGQCWVKAGGKNNLAWARYGIWDPKYDIRTRLKWVIYKIITPGIKVL